MPAKIRLFSERKNPQEVILLDRKKMELDPHFTINTIKTIASFFYLEDRQVNG
jgi:hypothetical protein